MSYVLIWAYDFPTLLLCVVLIWAYGCTLYTICPYKGVYDMYVICPYMACDVKNLLYAAHFVFSHFYLPF